MTIEEATILVGIPKNPTYYNPITNYENAKKRQKNVLMSMVKNKYITKFPHILRLGFPEVNMLHTIIQSSKLRNQHWYNIAKYTIDATDFTFFIKMVSMFVND